MKPFGQNSSELSYAIHSRQSQRKSPLGRNRSLGRPSNSRARDSLLREVPGGKETLLVFWGNISKFPSPAKLSKTRWLSWTRSVVAASVTRLLWSISSRVSVSLEIIMIRSVPARLSLSYLQVTLRALIMLFVAKFGRTK